MFRRPPSTSRTDTLFPYTTLFRSGVGPCCWLHIVVRRGALGRTGLVSGAFMIGYGIARIVAEFFREADPFLAFVLPGTTMGQVLSTPMVLVGIVVTLWALRRKA